MVTRVWRLLLLFVVLFPLPSSLFPIQGPSTIVVGRVTVVFWRGEDRIAGSLAAEANRAIRWPGIGAVPQPPLTLVLAGSNSRFDSLTGGHAPPWSDAVAFPESRTVVVKLKGDPARALLHELAHMALHSAVSGIPRWFDEGYAAWASGEWDRLDALRVDWEVARGAPPNFEDLNRDLEGEGGTPRAVAAYALSATAVQLLARIGGDRGLDPLMNALRHSSNLEAALRDAHGVTLDQFEELWHRDLRRRYGWLSFLTSATLYWGALAVLLVVAWGWRRRRDKARRLKLDEGWEIPPDEMPPSA